VPSRADLLDVKFDGLVAARLHHAFCILKLKARVQRPIVVVCVEGAKRPAVKLLPDALAAGNVLRVDVSTRRKVFPVEKWGGEREKISNRHKFSGMIEGSLFFLRFPTREKRCTGQDTTDW
jgi:hypothetical protein